MKRAILIVALICVTVIAVIEGAGYVGRHPQDFPWTRLDLNQPIGRFTGAKLAGLGDDADRCRALLADAGSVDRVVPALIAEPPCGYDDGMRLMADSESAIVFRPAGPVTSCPVAAALLLWERDIVQPAAERHFGQRIVAIDHAGSFACRRIYGRSEGRFSEHATANAFDVLGFRLADGRLVSVLRDWRGGGSDAAFLRDVRDGACRLFSTVLSPDYNQAHADHLHVDQAARGALGGRLCR